MSPFLQSVLIAVNSEPGEATAEALWERHGKTKTVSSWERALNKLHLLNQVSKRRCATYPTAMCPTDAFLWVYGKKP